MDIYKLGSHDFNGLCGLRNITRTIQLTSNICYVRNPRDTEKGFAELFWKDIEHFLQLLWVYSEFRKFKMVTNPIFISCEMYISSTSKPKHNSNNNDKKKWKKNVNVGMGLIFYWVYNWFR